jgi:signal peptidase I
MNVLKKLFTVLYEVLEASTFALGIFFVSYLFLFQTAEVHGNSSYPTLNNHGLTAVESLTLQASLVPSLPPLDTGHIS